MNMNCTHNAKFKSYPLKYSTSNHIPFYILRPTKQTYCKIKNSVYESFIRQVNENYTIKLDCKPLIITLPNQHTCQDEKLWSTGLIKSPLFHSHHPPTPRIPFHQLQRKFASLRIGSVGNYARYIFVPVEHQKRCWQNAKLLYFHM